MWIVRIALARPYTFIVLAILLLIIGPLAIIRTPTDIFPNINIPVVSVVWSYTGMPPKDMGQLITAPFERALTTTVLALTRSRHKNGAVPGSDVDEAESQLENAKTLAADIRIKRAQMEHAIAVLIGLPPADFSIAPAKTKMQNVLIYTHLPSTLLQRRPDIAAAEKRVQAANAQICVARAAFFPVFDLVAEIGFQSNKLSNLFSNIDKSIRGWVGRN